MSKMRSVQTTIWTKSERFRRCDAIEKLLFLFLITNPETNLCGAFEMMLDDIAHLTGIDFRNLPHVFEGLERKGLATYEDGWVIIPNYKAVYDNPKVQRGIEREREALPQHIKDRLGDSLSKTIPNSNSNFNLNSKEKRVKPPPGTVVPGSPTRYNNLCEKYGKSVVDDYVERVKDYSASKGKRYKDFVAAAANWMKRDEVKPKPVIAKTVHAPHTEECPKCGAVDIKQSFDELVCRGCDRAFVYVGGDWEEA